MGTTTDPLYLRVLEDLRAQIRDGTLGPGAKVPSRNGIITRYGVGETAAKHALQVLATEGLIETRAGSGSYVRPARTARLLEHDRPHFPGSPFGLTGASPPPGPPAGPGHSQPPGQPQPPGQRPLGLADGNGAAIALVVSWEHQTERARAPRHVAQRLCPAGDPLVIRTRYLLTADGTPVQVATSYEPAALTAHTAVAHPEEGPLAGRGVVERMRVIGVLVDQVVEDISVRPAASVEASALHIPAGAPVLAVEREHRAADRTVEMSEIIIPADGFRLRYRIPVDGTALPPGGQRPGPTPGPGMAPRWAPAREAR